MSSARTSARTRARERVWMILASDGRHVLVGRQSDPTDDELKSASDALADKGVTAWLAIREGDYYQRTAKLALLKVRSLTPSEGDWNAAVKAYEDLRRAYLSQMSY